MQREFLKARTITQLVLRHLGYRDPVNHSQFRELVDLVSKELEDMPVTQVVEQKWHSEELMDFIREIEGEA